MDRRLTSLALAAMLLAAKPAAPTGPAAAPDTLVLSDELRVRAPNGRSIEIQARVDAGGDVERLVERFAGKKIPREVIDSWNAPQGIAGGWTRVPLSALSDDYRSLVMLNLFPKDRRDADGWIHVARSPAIPLYDEGLWQVAEWFTGDGDRFAALMSANGLTRPELKPGQEVRIPVKLLHPAFQAVAGPSDSPLTYGRDHKGSYAGYRLKSGEALYSAVVLRFTGRTLPDDVNSVADAIAKRNGIPNFKDIPVHFLVKIPLDLLEPEFLPPGDPKRRETEHRRADEEAELARKPVAPAPKSLRGVLVVIDPGHGGRDLGTIQNGVQEHDHVYDIACRLKTLLETRTSARVALTLKDEETGWVVSAKDDIPANRQGTVLSTPPYLADGEGKSSVAVHLRWYVANSKFRQAVRDGIDPDRVIFLSIHADARHPSLRGLMVYVPGAQHRAGSFGRTSSPYRDFQEVREAPTVRLTQSQRLRSEAVSRRLGKSIVRAFTKDGLPVQTHVPIRSEVIRGRERWLPAVLRGNLIPASVLVELVNLANRDDAALLSKASAREEMAESLLSAVSRYFGEAPQGAGVAAAAAR